MATDYSYIEEWDTRYEEAYYAWDPFYPKADRDLRFFLGDQWDEKEKRDLFQEGRSTFVFNRVRRNINMITGYQRKHRLSSIVMPFEDADQLLADQYTKCLFHVMNYGDGYQIISDSFSGALKTGWNLINVWMDYRNDPVNGEIRFSREPYNGFILDPYLSRVDFSDCGYILKRKYLNVEQVASMLPKREKDLYMLYREGWERDDKFTWLPYQRQPNGQQLMAYDEMYQQKWRNVPTLVDMETGEMAEFDMDKETIKMFLRQYPQLEVIKRPKRYIEKITIVNNHFMDKEENPYGLDEYPFALTTAIFEPESDQWDLKVQSLIRCQIDPQREANRRRSQMSDILDSQINSGWIADENSVVNPRSLFQASQGKVIWKREDAKPDALTKIPPAQIPPSMFQLQEVFDNDMMEIVGVNDAAMGQIEQANESGVMMMLRQGASIVNLQEVFDNLRLTQKTLSKKVLKLIQTWTPEKIKRTINQEPAENFYDPDFVKYDVVVQEGILTETQRQMYFRQLVDLRQLGAPVTGEMLAKAAPIQGKSEYNEQLAELEKQQQEQAQQQQQIQQQVLQTQSQMSQAKAISDVALSKERFTRAVANMGLEDERASEAIHNRAQANLERVRAVKEIEMMDDERLMKYLTMIQMMEEMSKQKEEEVKEDDVNISAGANDAPQRTQVPQVPEEQIDTMEVDRVL